MELLKYSKELKVFIYNCIQKSIQVNKISFEFLCKLRRQFLLYLIQRIMRTFGNILWHFPFFGFITALSNFIIGGILTITVIGSPIGLGLIQLAKFQLTPFSNRMVDESLVGKSKPVAWNIFGVIIFIIYLPFGIVLALLTVIQICFLFISILGIPAAIVLSKSLSTYFNPVGKICVDSKVVSELEKEKAKVKAEKIINKD